MEFVHTYEERASAITALFQSTFSDSEGTAEGELIGGLAANLISQTKDRDIFVFSALESERVIGSIAFTRLAYPEDERTVFLLAPVAIATCHQGKGVGQKLLIHGLGALRAQGVDVVITYGDINFYAKAGFAQISEEVAQAPLTLQYPEGWLGQSLNNSDIEPLKGPSSCVEALNDPAYW